MADNTTLNSGTGGDSIATDDIAGIKYQRMKVVLGADGVNDGDVATGNPLPVTGNLAISNLVPGVAAADLGKAEDAAHSSGDTGVMALAVRQDANASLVGTNADYAPLQVDATGKLKVLSIVDAASVVSGQIALSGASAALSTVVARKFTIRAQTTNSDSIYIGPSGVGTTTGFPLWPGDIIEVEVSNLNIIHAIVGSGTQTLCYFGLV